MNKNLLLMNVLLAGAMLASCSGANGPGTPIVPSSSEEEATSESEAPIESPSSEESEKTSVDDSDFTTLNTLHVILYEKQVTNKDKVKEFQDGFAAFLAEKKVRIPTITWDYVGNDVVAEFSKDLKDFEAANYRGDVVLGAKAVAADKAPWFNENYECYTDNGTNVEIEFGGNTARRLWVNKNLGNPEEASYLIRYYRVLAGLPEVEETPGPIESSSEDIPDPIESSSEEPPVESSSEETVESSSEETPAPVAYPVLHVILYQKQVTDTAAVDTFKEGFATYLSDNLITIESITWDYVGTGKVATLSTELEAFEAANYAGDVVLGAKAVSTTDAPWFNENYEVYNTDAGTPFEFNFGGATARRIWTNKNGQNPEARAALIAYAQTLVA